jgi:hypothetical protein
MCPQVGRLAAHRLKTKQMGSIRERTDPPYGY